MVQLRNITKIYNKGKANSFTALSGVSLEIADGEMTAVMGRSGAGKSTLLHIMACIDSFEEGEYRLGGELLNGLSEKRRAALRGERIGLVMQDFALIEDFTVLENVLLPLELSAKRKRGRRARALAALESVGIAELAGKPAGLLSGGQKQRAAIARATVNGPALILADEPTGALDSAAAEGVMELFGRLNAEGGTIVIATHDRAVAERCKRIIRLADGRIV